MYSSPSRFSFPSRFYTPFLSFPENQLLIPDSQLFSESRRTSFSLFSFIFGFRFFFAPNIDFMVTQIYLRLPLALNHFIHVLYSQLRIFFPFFFIHPMVLVIWGELFLTARTDEISLRLPRTLGSLFQRHPQGFHRHHSSSRRSFVYLRLHFLPPSQASLPFHSSVSPELEETKAGLFLWVFCVHPNMKVIVFFFFPMISPSAPRSPRSLFSQFRLR